MSVTKKTARRPVQSKRLNLRVDQSSKIKIEKAATLSHQTVSGFVLSCAIEKAEKLLEKHETIVLSDRDRDRFLAALLNPPAPNKRFLKALEAHDKLLGKNG